MIEVIQSDFARLEAETSAAEAEASKQYDGSFKTPKLTRSKSQQIWTTPLKASRLRNQNCRRRRSTLKAPRRNLMLPLRIMKNSSLHAWVKKKASRIVSRQGRRRSSLSRQLSRSSMARTWSSECH